MKRKIQSRKRRAVLTGILLHALGGMLLMGVACQTGPVTPLPPSAEGLGMEAGLEGAFGTPEPAAENIPVEELERQAREQAVGEGLLPDAAAKTAGYQIYNPVGFYSQCDPSWGSVKLGNSTTLTICSDGCALTCVSMAYDRWGYSLNPKQLNTWGKSHGAFSGALVRWDKICDYGRNRSVRWISSNEIYGYLRSGWPVLIETDLHGGHWLYIYAFSKNGDGKYWTKDPLKDWTQQDQPLRGNFRRACVFTW